MNEHQNDFQPPMELPKPQKEDLKTPTEIGGTEQVSEQTRVQAIEQGVTQPGASPLPSPSLAAPISQPPTTDGSDSSSPLTVNNSVDTDSLIADDVDLIEKEWVYKAKEIVEKTKSDPHSQNKKMNEVKADYLKKRYNKELKLTED